MYKGSGSIEAAENFACSASKLDAAPPAPGLQFAFEARVDLGTPQEIGQRRVIPITGGTFAGPGIKGRVLNGGADWQILRTDGIDELHARYTLETNRGELIYVVVDGIRSGPDDIMQRLRSGQIVDPSLYYFRGSARLETSAPGLGWMNRSVFIISGERYPAEVVIRFWRVL